MRIRLSSESNRAVARARASSVFPTPIGPRKRNDPIGRRGFPMPARARSTVSATSLTASSCPTTRARRTWSRRRSFSRSPSRSRATGIPVQRETRSAISSAVTISRSNRWPPRRGVSRSDSSASRRSSSGRRVWRSSAAVARSCARSASSARRRACSISSRSPRTRRMAWRSASHRARIAFAAARTSASSPRSWSSRAMLAGSDSCASAASSISSRTTLRVILSRAVGIESMSVRSMAPASSTKSIALSGRKRSLMYRWDSTAAETSAASAIRTPWKISSRPRSPRRIEMVSVTDGSSIMTVWNWRANAGSDSICRRYSSSVVVPIRCRSPRISSGLSTLPASVVPSAAPAPRTACSSSTNSRIRPSDAVTWAITALSRSSNAPRCAVPAASAPRSSWNTLLFRRLSGTSPRKIRSARPSTIAVLPTPGSPSSTGLFFVRRDRIWITRRISASRPIRGSRRPLRASVTRSRPYFSSASSVAVGEAEMMRRSPRTRVSAMSRRSRVRPCSCRIRPAGVVGPSSSRASSRCSTEMYSSPRRCVSRSAASRALDRRCVMYTSSGRTPGPDTRGLRSSSASTAPVRAGGVPPDAIMRRGTSPSGCSMSAASRCSPSISVWPNRIALVWAAFNASWALSVSLVDFIGTPRRGRHGRGRRDGRGCAVRVRRCGRAGPARRRWPHR